jgi:Beta-ketoacyl synthase, N-terminal domain
MSPTTVSIRAIAAVGPGIADWSTLRAQLRAQATHEFAATVLPPSTALPPTERRRIGLSVKIALAVGEQLFANAKLSAPELQVSQTATIFTSSGGDGDNCHHLCTALTELPVMLSPTKFTNSVHNAPAGYFSIAHHAVQASNSICAHDGSFVQGLLEAAAYCLAEGQATALVAYDVPYPEPLNSKRSIAAPFGIALILDKADCPNAIAYLSLGQLANSSLNSSLTLCTQDSLEKLRSGIPAARGLPLLHAIANQTATRITLDAGQGYYLPVTLSYS